MLKEPETIAAPVAADQRLLGIVLCALAGASYGAQAIFAKLAYEQGANTLTVLTTRFVIGALGIWLLVALFRPSLRLSRAKLGGLAFLGVMFVVNAGLYYLSLGLLGAGTGALLGSTFPIWVVLWSVLFLHEPLDATRGGALLLALVGAALTVDPLNIIVNGEAFSWLGFALSVSSAFSYSIYIVLSSRIGRGVSGIVSAAVSMPVTAAIYCVIAFARNDFQWGMSALGWVYCAGIGIGVGLSVALYLVGLQMIGPSRAAIAQTTEPATAVILGILLLGEPTSLIKLLGGVFVVSAVVLLSHKPKAQ